MAKSLRSKRVQGNKVVKRKTVFGAAVMSREARIAERLHQAAIGEILAKQEGSKLPAESMEIETEAAPAQITPAASVKKATGGWSRKKKTRGKKSKKSRK